MKQGSAIRILVFVILIGCLILAACQTEKREIRAGILKGEAEIKKAGLDSWELLTSGTFVNIGDTIRTSGEGIVNLEINDGSIVGIMPDSEVTLDVLSPGINNPDTLFDLSDGLIYVKVTKELGKGSFKVRTPVLTGSVVGSKMAVQYIDETETADVTCFEGNVDAEFTGDVTENPTSCHMIEGVKLSASFDDEWTVTKCQHPVKVKRLETQAYSDWELISIEIEFMMQTENARLATQTKIARFTKTPTPTEVILPTETPVPSSTPTITLTPIPMLRPTITVKPGAPLSPEEQANQGTHNYSFTATYSGNCSGPKSGEFNGVKIEFLGNQVSLNNGSTETIFEKVDVNTYQVWDGQQAIFLNFSSTGFFSDVGCAQWIYSIEK